MTFCFVADATRISEQFQNFLEFLLTVSKHTHKNIGACADLGIVLLRELRNDFARITYAAKST